MTFEEEKAILQKYGLWVRHEVNRVFHLRMTLASLFCAGLVNACAYADPTIPANVVQGASVMALVMAVFHQVDYGKQYPPLFQSYRHWRMERAIRRGIKETYGGRMEERD